MAERALAVIERFKAELELAVVSQKFEHGPGGIVPPAANARSASAITTGQTLQPLGVRRTKRKSGAKQIAAANAHADKTISRSVAPEPHACHPRSTARVMTASPPKIESARNQ